MRFDDDKTEIFLQPGDYYFGDQNTRIRTVLGSCVSITMWHPSRKIGGMCHFMLPTRRRGYKVALDGRYADEAMALFMRDITSFGSRISEYQVKLFGAGNMFPKNMMTNDANSFEKISGTNVPLRNQNAALGLAEEFKLNVVARHLGGMGHRQVIFDVNSGDVWMRHCSIADLSKLSEVA